jgi:hypothetical protein
MKNGHNFNFKEPGNIYLYEIIPQHWAVVELIKKTNMEILHFIGHLEMAA